jgi:hypothetical protein
MCSRLKINKIVYRNRDFIGRNTMISIQYLNTVKGQTARFNDRTFETPNHDCQEDKLVLSLTNERYSGSEMHA